MAQAYVPQAVWNNGNIGGSLSNELKELERVNECQTTYGPVCSENEIIHDVLECEYNT